MTSDFIYDKEYKNNIFSSYEIQFKEFENCTFINCDFTQAGFSGTIFIDCTFYECNFKDAKIGHVGFRNAIFNQCNFTAVNFAMTDQVIHEFHFNTCLLDYAQFYALKLRKISFTNCSMVSGRKAWPKSYLNFCRQCPLIRSTANRCGWPLPKQNS